MNGVVTGMIQTTMKTHPSKILKVLKAVLIVFYVVVPGITTSGTCKVQVGIGTVRFSASTTSVFVWSVLPDTFFDLMPKTQSVEAQIFFTDNWMKESTNNFKF